MQVRMRRLLGATAAAAAVLVTAGPVAGTATASDLVLVPDVDGMTLTAATNALHEAGLGAVTHGSTYSCDALPGRVINQIPQPVTFVPVGTGATLTVARALPPGRLCP